MTAAQAQAQAQVAATEAQSVQCVQVLIRLAVYQLCSLRGLFPDDAFNTRSTAELQNMRELKVRVRFASCGLSATVAGACFKLRCRHPGLLHAARAARLFRRDSHHCALD